MKVIKICLVQIFLLLVISGCDVLTAAADNASGNCVESICYYALYDNDTGKYKDDYYRAYDSKGNDVGSTEFSWIKRKVNYYAGLYYFDVYYVTSPHTGAEYKFSSSCYRYANSY